MIIYFRFGMTLELWLVIVFVVAVATLMLLAKTAEV